MDNYFVCLWECISAGFNLCMATTQHRCVVSSCCCGCTLKTGSTIIGWLSLIYDASYCAELAFEMAAEGSYKGFMPWILLLMQIGHLVAAILLLVGISNSNVQYIKIYVYVTTVRICLGVIAVVFTLIFFIMDPSSLDDGGELEGGDLEGEALAGVGLMVIVIVGIAVGLEIYYLVVVRSYAISLEEGPLQTGVVHYQQGQPVNLAWQQPQHVQPGMTTVQMEKPGMEPGMQSYPTQPYPTQSYPTQPYPTQSYPTQSYPYGQPGQNPPPYKA